MQQSIPANIFSFNFHYLSDLYTSFRAFLGNWMFALFTFGFICPAH